MPNTRIVTIKLPDEDLRFFCNAIQNSQSGKILLLNSKFRAIYNIMRALWWQSQYAH
jgi:hypothetical protein